MLSILGYLTHVIAVRNDSRYKTLADLIAAAKAAPGTITYSSVGVGSTQHLAGELLKYMAKVDITPVPYKGGAPTLNDLLGGHIPMSINNIPESLAQIQADITNGSQRHSEVNTTQFECAT